MLVNTHERAHAAAPLYLGSKPLTTTTLSLPDGPFGQRKVLVVSKALDGTVLVALHSNSPVTPELEFGFSGALKNVGICLMLNHGLSLGKLCAALQADGVYLHEIDEVMNELMGD